MLSRGAAAVLKTQSWTESGQSCQAQLSLLIDDHGALHPQLDGAATEHNDMSVHIWKRKQGRRAKQHLQGLIVIKLCIGVAPE
jgi:hypothetical protein